ncbi:hypothetical protein B296_00020960 [Ensete ventricosum]|uniref:Uncharacterized protein n=1 Tax=Ensete ventricosum TaxID=4639 RepID=A0A426Z2P5_ENSVE|nr:hypothetical protein B296_00020960 [Ensete ventricosum]
MSKPTVPQNPNPRTRKIKQNKQNSPIKVRTTKKATEATEIVPTTRDSKEVIVERRATSKLKLLRVRDEANGERGLREVETKCSRVTALRGIRIRTSFLAKKTAAHGRFGMGSRKRSTRPRLLFSSLLFLLLDSPPPDWESR